MTRFGAKSSADTIEASETNAGIAELATQSETDTGTDDNRIVTPLKAATRFLAKAGGTLTGFLTLHADPTSALHAVTKQYADGLVSGGASPASETVAGIAELATTTETNTGTDDERIVTPLKLAGRTATETRSGGLEIATQAETDTGTDDTRAVTPAKLANFSGLGGGGSRTLVTLGSDVTINTVAHANVTGLSFSVTSGTTYRFSARLIYTLALATTAAAFSVNGPASPTLLSYQMFWASTSGTTLFWQVQNTYDASSISTASPATGPLIAMIEGIVIPSASGTFIVRARTEADALVATVKAGSAIAYE